MLSEWIKKYSQEFELEDALETGIPGTYEYPIDEDISVMITEIPRGFSLKCSQIECPSEINEEFFQHALFGNLYGQGTEGAVLGLDLEGKRLTLSRDIDYTIEYQDFKDILEDFLNSVDFWKREVASYGTPHAS